MYAQKGVGPLLAGAGTAGIEALLVGAPGGGGFYSGTANSTGILGNFLVGAGSYVAADYVAGMMKP
jgi:hypothetical protein